MTNLRWPTPVRGKSNKAAGAASWFNRLLEACKMGTITDVKVVGGVGKMVQSPMGTTLIIDPKVTGGGNGWRKAASGYLYNKDDSISEGEIIYMPSTDPMVTAGTIDPDTGQMVTATPGKWVALQDVAPVVNPPGLPAGTYYHIPQLPIPTPGDLDNTDPDLTAYGSGEAQNYWDIVTPDTVC